MAATGAGNINTGLNSCFLAILGTSVTSVTGDNTTYTIICDTVIFDQNSNYNNSTGTFTAPVTGKYLVNYGMAITSLSAAFVNVQPLFTATSRSVIPFNIAGTAANSSNQLNFSGSFYIDMSSTNTLVMKVSVGNSTKTVGLAGDATNMNTWFSATLVC